MKKCGVRPIRATRQSISDIDFFNSIRTKRALAEIVDKLYRKQPHAKLKIANWAIEHAFKGLGDRQLTLEEQEAVMLFARKSRKIAWPDWWEARSL